MNRSALVMIGGAVAAALCLHNPAARAAGELQGQVLRPARDVETGIEAVIGGLLGGKHQPPPPGSIGSATVTEDGPQRLTITVECTGDLQGRRFRGELLDAGHRYQRQFRTAPIRVEGDKCGVDLSFEPKDGAAGDALAVSEYVRVSVDGGGPALKRLFTLGKAWGGGSSGGGSSAGLAYVKVKARPEPKAAALPTVEPTPGPVPTPQPARVVRDHRGDAPVVRRRPTPPETHDRGDGGQPETRDHRQPRRPDVVDHRGEGRPAWTPRPAATPVPPPQREAVLAKTAGVLQAMPHSSTVFTLQANAFALSDADRNKGARGPNVADQLDLGPEIETEPGVTPSLLMRIGTLFRDQDPATGYFYFVPEAYHLGWLKDQGRYDMAMLYLAATTPGSAGEVSMAAGLTSGIDSDEIQMVRRLLKAYCTTHACVATELRPFPIDPARVAVSLSGSLRLFNIPAEKVAPVGMSDALGSFKLAWVTDPVTKENVQLVLEESGIDGSVTFAAAGAEQSSSLVNVRIKLGDPGSFGRSYWRRGAPWRNPTPYPVRVKYLHALMANPGATPTVYSWNLGGAVVAPGGSVDCDASAVPQWVDGKALRMWVDYGVAGGCESCTRQVVKDITGGVTSVNASQITFRTFKPLAELGAHEVAVKVRSKHFDPDGRQMRLRSVVLSADDHDFTLGPIYADEADGHDPLFEYFLTVAMADGTEYEAREWIASSDLRVVIGRSQIEKALGFVPGASPSAPPTPGAPGTDRDEQRDEARGRS